MKIYKTPKFVIQYGCDILGGIDGNLVEIEERMSDVLKRCNLDSFVSVETIKMWMTDIEEKGSTSSLTMLTGLLDKAKLQNKDLIEELLNTMIRLSHLLPAKALDGETFSDVLIKRKKRKESTNLYLTHMDIPPLEWCNYYHKAMYYTHKQKFLSASKKYDETFKKLLELKTTNQNIYRVFCNAGLAYLLSGKPLLGVNCFEMAYELNSKYSFAYKQLQKYHKGEFDPYIQLGMLTEMKNNIEKWKRRPDYLNWESVMKWSEEKIIKKLSSFGVTIDKEEFIKLAKTVNRPDEIAKKIMYPQSNAKGHDEDFIWIAAYCLWDIYCPDEPSVPSFNEEIHKAFNFASKNVLKNKDKKKSKEALEKKYSKYFKALQKYIYSDKKGFLQAWHKTLDDMMDPSFELKTFLASLLSISKLEENVLDVVHHLNNQIPHPDWTTVEIISKIKNNDSQGNELFKKLKHNYPYYCYVACDIADYYLQKKDFLQAEFYLIEALKIVDARAEKNKLSIDTIETTIYDDYTYVFNLLKKVYRKSNAESKKVKTFKAKMREVEKKSEIYSESPAIKKMDNAINSIITRMDKKIVENSYAVQYYNYLKQFEINFETEKTVKVDMSPINILSKGYGSYKDNKKNSQWKQNVSRKIGRNEPCPCGSGKKYKKCCEAIVKK